MPAHNLNVVQALTDMTILDPHGFEVYVVLFKTMQI